MCGIAGFIDFSFRSAESDLRKMTDTLTHRGPDAAGYSLHSSIHAAVGLGHRRLSIVDLSATGSQPMHFQHLHIVYNGEIYNYKQIKQELQLKGHQFEGNSDTEVILHAYLEWGMEMLQSFIGMFVFCLYDEQLQKVILVRDRAGVKPLYYAQQQQTVLFGSELKVFHQHPAYHATLNTAAVKQFLQYGYIAAPLSIFQNTHKLLPGHYAELNLANQQWSFVKYWDALDAYQAPANTKSFEEITEDVEVLLKDACKLRMVADVPVGVFLSGGYDSSLVTALLQHDSSTKLKTFTIGFKEKKYNEAEHAKKVAAHLGTDHHEHYCSIDDARSIIPELPYYFDEPFADASAIPTILVSRMARQEVKVALSADAGDEVFAGYDKYRHVMSLNKKLSMIPAPLRKLIASTLEHINPSSIPYFNQQYNFETRYYKGIALLKDKLLMQQFEGIAKFFPDQQLSALLLDTATATPGLLPLQDIATIAEPLQQLLFADYRTYMVDDILVKVDRASMSASLEGREPLLDHRILEYAAGIPADMKFGNGIQKRILKHICHKYIPESIMNRPKMGFGIPMIEWFNQEIGQLADELLNEHYINQQGIFSAKAIQAELAQYRSNKSGNVHRLWNILMFQLWYKKWM